jgi:hypothetical protein
VPPNGDEQCAVACMIAVRLPLQGTLVAAEVCPELDQMREQLQVGDLPALCQPCASLVCAALLAGSQRVRPHCLCVPLCPPWEQLQMTV